MLNIARSALLDHVHRCTCSVYLWHCTANTEQVSRSSQGVSVRSALLIRLTSLYFITLDYIILLRLIRLVFIGLTALGMETDATWCLRANLFTQRIELEVYVSNMTFSKRGACREQG